VTNLKAIYSAQKSAIGASVTFIRRKQREGENIEGYSRALNDLGSQCEYKDCCRSRLVRDQFIAGLRSKRLITALITECEGKSFEDTVTRAKQLEQITADVEDIIPERNDGRVYLNKYQKGSGSNYKKEGFKKPFGQGDKNTKVNSSYICIRCTAKGKHVAKDCFALKVKCNKCGKLGHIAKACRSKDSQKGEPHKANHIEKAYQEPPEEYDTARFFNVKRVQKQAPKEQEHMSTRNRYQGLQEFEEEWPEITDHRQFRYAKRDKGNRRKGRVPAKEGNPGTSSNGNESSEHFLGKCLGKKQHAR